MTSSHQDGLACHWFSHVAAFLDRRSAPMQAWLFLRALLARGRRTVTSWIRAAGTAMVPAAADHHHPVARAPLAVPRL
jgi:hypothetical protein